MMKRVIPIDEVDRAGGVSLEGVADMDGHAVADPELLCLGLNLGPPAFTDLEQVESLDDALQDQLHFLAARPTPDRDAATKATFRHPVPDLLGEALMGSINSFSAYDAVYVSMD